MRLGHNSFQRNRRIKRILLTRFSKFRWTAVETWHASISNYLTSTYEFSIFLFFFFRIYVSYRIFAKYDVIYFIFFFLCKSFSRYYINSNPRIIKERRHRRMKIFLLSFFPSFFFLFYESFIKNDRMLPTRCRDIIKICLLGFDLIPPTIPFL